MGDPLELVAVDIETTGFAVEDEVTVVGFVVPIGCRVLVQTTGQAHDDVAAAVEGRVDSEVVLSLHDSEAALLQAVNEFVRMRLCDDDVLLVGYHAETWRGGFDLPFLRTRYATHGLAWPFDDVPYADLLPIYQKLFNTTCDDGEEPSDLVSVYEMFGDGGHGALDPFDESSEAVTAFEAGHLADVVVHNVADILRTAELGRQAQRYCAKSDFSLKSLTPTVGGGTGDGD